MPAPAAAHDRDEDRALIVMILELSNQVRQLQTALTSQIHALHHQGELMAADLTELKDAVSDLVAEVAVVVTTLDDLAAKVAAGGTVTQADLDSLSADLRGSTTKLSDAVATDDPPAPPVEPTP